MSGLDSAIPSLLASRTDLFVSVLRAAAGQTATQTSVANTASTAGTDAPSLYGPTGAPVASTQTALSSVARTLDVISRLGGSAPPVVGDAPLWAMPPRPASAFAALTTGLFDTAFSSNASAVAAARAASQNMPPLPVAQVAAQLSKTVGESGLFYESHLAQWVSGQRSVASLGGEPQARVDASTQSLPLDFTDPQSTGIPWIDDVRPALAASVPHDAPDTPHAPDAGSAPPTPHAIVMPQTPNEAAALAASLLDAPASALSNSQHAPTSEAGAAASPAATHEAVMQASLAAGINPAALNTVRQQLDMLANGLFRWQGEAWPGTRFDWEIERDRTPRAPDDLAAETAWRTRVTLDLPALGLVDADLVLTGDKLVVRIRASDTGASRLASDGASFAQRVKAAGLALASLSVRSMEGAEFDGNGDACRAGPKAVPSPLAHLFTAPGDEGNAP